MHQEDTMEGWGVWSRHIVKEMEKLSELTDKLRDGLEKTNLEVRDLRHLDKEIGTLKSGIDSMKEEFTKSSHYLRKNIDDVIEKYADDYSEEIKEFSKRIDILLTKIDTLEKFQVKMSTIGVIITFAITIALSVMGWFKWD